MSARLAALLMLLALLPLLCAGGGVPPQRVEGLLSVQIPEFLTLYAAESFEGAKFLTQEQLSLVAPAFWDADSRFFLTARARVDYIVSLSVKDAPTFAGASLSAHTLAACALYAQSAVLERCPEAEPLGNLVYAHEQALFLKLFFRFHTADGPVYGVRYLTLLDGREIRLDLIALFPPIVQACVGVLDRVLDGVRFENPPTGYTRGYAYEMEGPDGRFGFEVPAGWHPTLPEFFSASGAAFSQNGRLLLAEGIALPQEAHASGEELTEAEAAVLLDEQRPLKRVRLNGDAFFSVDTAWQGMPGERLVHIHGGTAYGFAYRSPVAGESFAQEIRDMAASLALPGGVVRQSGVSFAASGLYPALLDARIAHVLAVLPAALALLFRLLVRREAARRGPALGAVLGFVAVGAVLLLFYKQAAPLLAAVFGGGVCFAVLRAPARTQAEASGEDAILYRAFEALEPLDRPDEPQQ